MTRPVATAARKRSVTCAHLVFRNHLHRKKTGDGGQQRRANEAWGSVTYLDPLHELLHSHSAPSTLNQVHTPDQVRRIDNQVTEGSLVWQEEPRGFILLPPQRLDLQQDFKRGINAERQAHDEVNRLKSLKTHSGQLAMAVLSQRRFLHRFGVG